MRYGQVEEGQFVERPNRFIAYVDTAEGRQRVHVKNTGRCRELLVPGATVYLERGTTPGRKTDWDLIAVRKGERLINMDAQAPNRVFEEWARAGPVFAGCDGGAAGVCLWRLPAGLLFETPRGRHLVEVKGVTLEENGAALFPTLPRSGGSSTSGN